VEVNTYERNTFPANTRHIDGSDDAHDARLKEKRWIAAVVAVVAFNSFLDRHTVANV